jgi:hypothetical protein
LPDALEALRQITLDKQRSGGALTVYLDLILALVATFWFAETTVMLPAKLAIAGVIVVSILPNMLDQALWACRLETPEFFTTRQVRDYLRPGENVLPLPFSANGQSMTWQALSGMYFASAGGWTGPTPRSFAAWPILESFEYGVDIPEEDQQLLAFMAAHRVTAVVIDRNQPQAPRWLALMDPRTTEISTIDGVILARPSKDALAPYLGSTAEQMQCRRDDRRFRALVAAAAAYLQHGYPVAQLTPLAAQERKLLPASWVNEEDRDAISRAGLELGPWQADRTIVGVRTNDRCARSLAERYRLYSNQVFFPYPHALGERLLMPDSQGQFAIVFSPQALARTAH